MNIAKVTIDIVPSDGETASAKRLVLDVDVRQWSTANAGLYPRDIRLMEAIQSLTEKYNTYPMSRKP